MKQKGNVQYALSTGVIAELLLKVARSETTILEGALALFTTPLGAMLSDGSFIDNSASLLILLVIINAALRFMSDATLQSTMNRALREKLGVAERDEDKEGGGPDAER